MLGNPQAAGRRMEPPRHVHVEAALLTSTWPSPRSAGTPENLHQLCLFVRSSGGEGPPVLFRFSEAHGS